MWPPIEKQGGKKTTPLIPLKVPALWQGEGRGAAAQALSPALNSLFCAARVVDFVGPPGSGMEPKMRGSVYGRGCYG